MFLERLNSDVLQGQVEVEEVGAADSVAVEWEEDVVEVVVEEDLEEAGMRETIVEDGVEAEVVSTMELSKYLFNQSDFSESYCCVCVFGRGDFTFFEKIICIYS